MRLWLMALLLVLACSPQRRIEKAKQTVLTNPAAFDSIGGIWAELHPCVSDTVLDMVTDTLYGENLVFTDTVFVPTERVKYIYKTITKTPTIVEKKTTAFTRDKRQEEKLKEQLTQKEIAVSYLNGSIAEKEKQIDSEKKRANKLWYWLIGISILCIVSHIFRSFIIHKLHTINTKQ